MIFVGVLDFGLSLCFAKFEAWYKEPSDRRGSSTGAVRYKPPLL